MCTNDPLLHRPSPAPEGQPSGPENQARPRQLVERLPYDAAFTDELIRRGRARAAQGYRIAATFISRDKTEVAVLFEHIEWAGVPFPGKEPEGGPDASNVSQ